jgi:hypothetical protein
MDAVAEDFYAFLHPLSHKKENSKAWYLKSH